MHLYSVHVQTDSSMQRQGQTASIPTASSGSSTYPHAMHSGGIRGSLLIPEAPFELLVRRAIERLLPPALQARGCGCVLHPSYC